MQRPPNEARSKFHWLSAAPNAVHAAFELRRVYKTSQNAVCDVLMILRSVNGVWRRGKPME